MECIFSRVLFMVIHLSINLALFFFKNQSNVNKTMHFDCLYWFFMFFFIFFLSLVIVKHVAHYWGHRKG